MTLPIKLKLKRKIKTVHPEQLEDEVFISNETRKTFKTIAWKTKRLGNLAYDMMPMLNDKKFIIIKNLFPCFIKRKEMEDYRENKFIKSDSNKV